MPSRMWHALFGLYVIKVLEEPLPFILMQKRCKPQVLHNVGTVRYSRECGVLHSEGGIPEQFEMWWHTRRNKVLPRSTANSSVSVSTYVRIWLQSVSSRKTAGNVNFTEMEKLNIRVRVQGHHHTSHVLWASRSNTVPTTGLRKYSESVQVLYGHSVLTCPSRTWLQREQRGLAPEQPTRVSCVRVSPLTFRFSFSTLLGGGSQRENILLLPNGDQRCGGWGGGGGTLWNEFFPSNRLLLHFFAASEKSA
jgi:hypothetical protein